MPIRSVGDAMDEMKKGSKHIKTRAQAIAVGLKAEGKSKKGKKRSAVQRQADAFEHPPKMKGGM